MEELRGLGLTGEYVGNGQGEEEVDEISDNESDAGAELLEGHCEEV